MEGHGEMPETIKKVYDGDDDPLALSLQFPCKRPCLALSSPPQSPPPKESASTDFPSSFVVPAADVTCPPVSGELLHKLIRDILKDCTGNGDVNTHEAIHVHDRPPRDHHLQISGAISDPGNSVNPPPPLQKHQKRSSGGNTQRSRTQAPPHGNKSETIPPAYIWASDRRANVFSLEYLLSRGIHAISGEVQCKRCEHRTEMSYDLCDKFQEVASYVRDNMAEMRTRAPQKWLSPELPTCPSCSQPNCLKPVIQKKRAINWLFIFVAQTIGCCTLNQLKYFCKHNRCHRTGSKEHVLYLTYMSILRQLDPHGRFYPSNLEAISTIKLNSDFSSISHE